jgi:hypothetical protein
MFKLLLEINFCSLIFCIQAFRVIANLPCAFVKGACLGKAGFLRPLCKEKLPLPLAEEQPLAHGFQGLLSPRNYTIQPPLVPQTVQSYMKAFNLVCEGERMEEEVKTLEYRHSSDIVHSIYENTN